jgi:hypothetical protein
MSRKRAGRIRAIEGWVESRLPAGDKIDPIVDQWLQQLVKVAVAIAARENGETEGKDGESINT